MRKNKTKVRNNLNNISGYIMCMEHSGNYGRWLNILKMLPVILFTAVTITIVRFHIYYRPMSRFYWTASGDTTPIPDLFSYYKMRFIIIVTGFALAVIILRVISKTFVIKRCSVYIPMIIYSAFVIISYIGSNYKEFSLLGFNERFEGTIPLLCYMVMLFYTINSIDTEKDLRVLLWSLGIVSALLCILGISQAVGHDFFNTLLGQKLITPYSIISDGSSSWDAVERSFNAGELFYNFDYGDAIYQTVYNQNYVAFYLIMIIPIFGSLFIRSLSPESDEPIWKKIILGILCLLLIYNIIGSVSSSAYLGLGVVVAISIIFLRKQIIRHWKHVLLFLIIVLIVLGVTKDRWREEVEATMFHLNNTLTYTPAEEGAEYGSARPWIDYIQTSDRVMFMINGNPLILDYAEDAETVRFDAFDSSGNKLGMTWHEDGFYSVDDERFYPYVKINISQNDLGQTFLNVNTAGRNWPFHTEGNRIYYVNSYSKGVALTEIEHIGFDKRPDFGSGRGYIWSRTFPLLKKTIITGYGPDTFCAVFPQNDYAGRYNEKTYDIAIVIDKPHNMYLNTAVCSGVISLIALIAVYGIYVVQSIRVFWKRDCWNDLSVLTGFSIFCGLTAFMILGLLNDSSVSVMPMFYGLLGAGFSINQIIKKQNCVGDGRI